MFKNLKFILVNLFKYMEYLSLQCAEHQMLVKVYLLNLLSRLNAVCSKQNNDIALGF